MTMSVAAARERRPEHDGWLQTGDERARRTRAKNAGEDSAPERRVRDQRAKRATLLAALSTFFAVVGETRDTFSSVATSSSSGKLTNRLRSRSRASSGSRARTEKARATCRVSAREIRFT